MYAADQTVVPAPSRPFVDLTLLSLALLVLALLWGGLEAREVEGVPVWIKPAKFAAAFAVHFGTLALIVSTLSVEARQGRGIAFAGGAMAAAFLGEMAYLFFQAARAEASHFNFSTPLHAAAYQAMGVGAVLLIAGPVAVVHVALRDGGTRFGPSLRSGLRWGAWLSFALTLVVAGTMSNIGRHVGLHPDDGAILPVFGWSGVVGDLRPAHFLSLHALQALPLLGLWFDRRGIGPVGVRLAAALWTALTIAVFVQALAGMPLIRL